MKTYQEHLKSVLSFGETVSSTRKPVFRSSAIFPVMENETFSTQVLFMGYWLKKRNIPEVTILLTLRNEFGKILLRKTIIVDQIKAFKIPISSLISEVNDASSEFIGSIELEVFSTRDMVFPYPAFVINYLSDYGSTAVHTTGRVYNDIEDMSSNAKYRVPESGFDIYAGKENEPFFCFVNGITDNSNKEIKCEIIDEDQNVTYSTILIDEVKPYQSCFVMLKKYIDLDKILNGKKGTIRLQLDFEGFFPRIIAGNFTSNKAVSITHSFYDSSSVKDENAYLNNSNPDLHDSYVFIPIFLDNDMYTHLVYYPIYSPSDYLMDLYFYDQNGNLIKKLDKWKSFSVSDNLFFTIDFNRVANEHFSPEERKKIKGMMIVNHWNGNNIPTRIKYGLNIGIQNREFDLPTNICFAPEISNPKILNKPGTFKWAPILNSHNSKVIITNCGPQKNYYKPANIKIEFYRESDSKTIEETVWLLPFAQYVININSLKDLSEFFGKDTGWITISSDNPFVNAWYFDINNETGVVAGDHSF